MKGHLDIAPGDKGRICHLGAQFHVVVDLPVAENRGVIGRTADRLHSGVQVQNGKAHKTKARPSPGIPVNIGIPVIRTPVALGMPHLCNPLTKAFCG